MTKDFKGQVAIVTGAGSGIGFEIAAQLVANGCQVVLNDVNVDLAQHATEKINNANCISMAGDASEVHFIQKMVDSAVTKFGKLTLCIANAGITTYGTFLDFTPERFETLVNLNLRGSFFLSQLSAKQMIKQKSGGRILFISSVTGVLSHPYLAAYGMTKAALQMLPKALVWELAPHNITTNAIAPGAVLTERTIAEDANYAKVWSQYIPSGHISLPRDIATGALFLLSKEASQITGQTIVIDGGATSVVGGPDDLDFPDD